MEKVTEELRKKRGTDSLLNIHEKKKKKKDKKDKKDSDGPKVKFRNKTFFINDLYNLAVFRNVGRLTVTLTLVQTGLTKLSEN